MSRNTLIILTHHFPVNSGEEFLIDELEITSAYFDKVLICPITSNVQLVSNRLLPTNTSIVSIINSNSKGNKFQYTLKFIPILWIEFMKIPYKNLFYKLLKFNLSLLKQCYQKALNLKEIIKQDEKTIIYSYWCDDLALTGSFCKMLMPQVTFISRAHGFDVFEEQSDFKHIFFRSFQLKYLNKLFAVSEVGAQHLKVRNSYYEKKIDTSYLGIKSNGENCFEETTSIRLVTCSHIRSIKRLNLLVNTLKLMPDKQIEWHVIGDGPDLEDLKNLSLQLPSNCRLIFYGHINTEKIHEIYSTVHFDFLVSLSSSEALPVSMMEAISHGIPILSTNVGGCKEIVNERTGILIPINCPIENIATILNNCKQGIFNEPRKRQSIVEFWKENFNSTLNYKKFAEKILSV